MLLRILWPLYGLPTSGYTLYESLGDWLQRIGLHKCATDPTLYVYRTAKHELLVSTTVDDMVFAGSSNEIIKAFVNAMKRKFRITHDQNPSHILGFDLHDYTKGDVRVIAMDVSQAV